MENLRYWKKQLEKEEKTTVVEGLLAVMAVLDPPNDEEVWEGEPCALPTLNKSREPALSSVLSMSRISKTRQGVLLQNERQWNKVETLDSKGLYDILRKHL